MADSSYRRGYDAARRELSAELQKHNTQLAVRLSDLTRPAILDALGNPSGPPPLSDYDRGVLNGALAANRTLLMFLGHVPEGETKAEIKPLGIQAGD